MKEFKRRIILQAFPLLLACALTLSLAGIASAADSEKSQGRKAKWREYFGQRKTAESDDELSPEGMVDYIDMPTTNVIDYGAFRTNFRLYSKGSLQTHLSFGVFRRLNLGATWDVEKLIGAEDPSANVPTLNVKFRVYDGAEILPSFAIGYDGQGRFFDKAADQYRERERGLFGVIGREIFFPKLEAYCGANISRFKEGEVYGSVGASYTIEEKLAILVEYDNLRKAPQNRLNAGFRIFPIPSLGIDFAVRNITNTDERERIIRINYVGSF